MRKAFADTFYRLAATDERLFLLCADMWPPDSDDFRATHPTRFINVGVAEQAMIGIAAGLALTGARPFAYAIATFSLYRPFEMVRDDLCYQGLPVTVVGMGAGLAYSSLGGTHQAIEDVAIASSLPNMTVLAPADALEVAAATTWCATQSRGPVYLRIGKVGEPVVTRDAQEPFEFGKLRWLARGDGDLCLLSYGPMVARAQALAERLRAGGRLVSLASVHTLKPLPVSQLAEALATHRHVAVIEEHVAAGGLGMQVKGIAWDTAARCRLDTFALQDAFVHRYGSHDELLAAHGLSVDALVARLA